MAEERKRGENVQGGRVLKTGLLLVLATLFALWLLVSFRPDLFFEIPEEETPQPQQKTPKDLQAPAAPRVVACTPQEFGVWVTLAWPPVEGAVAYQVYDRVWQQDSRSWSEPYLMDTVRENRYCTVLAQDSLFRFWVVAVDTRGRRSSPGKTLEYRTPIVETEGTLKYRGTPSPSEKKPGPPPPVGKAPDETLVVEGPEWFRVQMLASLDLLRQKDPENYSFVLDHLDVIRPGERSEVDVLTKTFCRKPSSLRRPTILESWIFGAGKDYETIEEAAILVHEAAHVYLFEQGEKYSGEEGEAWAINRQLQCLERLEAPYWMKNELPLAYETHYWEVPRKERNW